MNRKILYLAILVLAGCIASNQQSCVTGPSVIDQSTRASTSPTPTPTPTPTPVTVTVTVTPTPHPCSFVAMGLDFYDNSAPTIAVKERKQLDLTPLDANGKAIPDACNTIREPHWLSADPTVCEVIGGGFVPVLLGVQKSTTGCVVSATLVDEFRAAAVVVSQVFRPEVK